MPAVTINQEYEPRIASKQNSERAAEIFPDLAQSEVNPLQSIGIVLSQALSTKDKQAIKELLVTSSIEIVKNTVSELSVSKVGVLLESLENLLLEEGRGTKNIQILGSWLGEVLKKNIGHIINNPELQQQAAKISRIIKKRVENLATLNSLNNQIQYRRKIETSEAEKYVPKFHYIEEENEMIEGEGLVENLEEERENSNISEIGEEDLAVFDDMMMDDGL